MCVVCMWRCVYKQCDAVHGLGYHDDDAMCKSCDLSLSSLSLSLSRMQLAFKYLGCILFPLFICYAIYSITYLEHKGWYSFTLGMSYGFLLTFGLFYIIYLIN